VLLGAALYEFTPLKSACLTKCRSPVSFLLGSWRPGRAGALTMGIEHGAWCLGCCWALMAALFALGAMSMTWMILIAALIAAEKLLPWRTAATGGVAVLLVVLAVGLAASPGDVPALTVPGGGGAMGMSK
jgi:predicted metal-binding membrane protein